MDHDLEAISASIIRGSFTGSFRCAFHRNISPDATVLIAIELAALAPLATSWIVRPLGVEIVVVTGASLIATSRARNPPAPSYDVAPSPAISWIQREAPRERVASRSRDTLTPNVNALFGIRRIDLQVPPSGLPLPGARPCPRQPGRPARV